MGQFIVGIDVGLSFTKSVIYDLKGNLIIESKKQTPIAVNDGVLSEIKLKELWLTVKLVTEESLCKSEIKSSDIIGVGVSGYGNGVCLLDKNKEPLINGITSMDLRALGILKSKGKKIYHKLKKNILQNLWAGQPALILMWIKENKPEIYEQVGGILFCKDWITYCLTGELTTDFSDISASGLIDNVKKDYSKKIFRTYGIDELSDSMPKVLKSYQIAGTVCKKSANDTGLKEGTPVIAGLFDVDACGIGAGLINTDQICSIAGTWNINMGITKNFTRNNAIRQCTVRGDGSNYLMIDSSPTSVSNNDWFLTNILNQKDNFELFEGIMKNYKPQDDQIIFLPLINGGLGNENPGGTFTNIRSFNSSRDMFRAVAEGVCFAHYYHINNLIKAGVDPKTIRLTGGATKNGLWNQLFSDVVNLPVEIPESPQTGALGVSIMVAKGAGIYKSVDEAIENMVRTKYRFTPKKEAHVIYQDKYKKFIELLTNFKK